MLHDVRPEEICESLKNLWVGALQDFNLAAIDVCWIVLRLDSVVISLGESGDRAFRVVGCGFEENDRVFWSGIEPGFFPGGKECLGFGGIVPGDEGAAEGVVYSCGIAGEADVLLSKMFPDGGDWGDREEEVIEVEGLAGGGEVGERGFE